MDVLARADVRVRRFLGIEQIDAQLPEAIRQLDSSSVRHRLVEVLLECCTFDESRTTVALTFQHDDFVRSDGALAAAAGHKLKMLHKRVKQDLGLTPHVLRRWGF
jgi:hypothetical protein